MMRKDYIVRQLEEFGKVLGVILFLKRDKDWGKFQEEVAQAARRFTSLEIDHVEKLTPDAFFVEVVENPSIELEQKKILAGILFEKLDYYIATNLQAKEQDTATKCLVLYSFLHGNQTQNEFNLEVHYRLEFLKKTYT